MQKRITAFICRHSNTDADTITRLMMNPDDMAGDVGTIIDGAEAVSHGIIDQVGGLSDALAALRAMTDKQK
jgi:ATP-dependent protease ClpP protease subunit